MLDLILTLMKISIIGLGGGYGMLPIMREELVEKKKKLKDSEFLSIIAKAQSVPGPIALNTAILLGRMEKGVLGSILCALSIVIPPFFAILGVAIFFEKFRHVKLVESFMKGARIGVTIIIINFAINLMRRIMNHRFAFFMLALLIGGSLAIIVFKVPSILSFLVVAFIIVPILKLEEGREKWNT
ncbi:MAG: hypothetical protein DRP30_07950 [Thermotoga sp.]|nr:MAG: hypothetical protein DRP30_07950 [Thermotoga sp.]HDM69828.1 chromate transporter [Thermotogales bacterium]